MENNLESLENEDINLDNYNPTFDFKDYYEEDDESDSENGGESLVNEFNYNQNDEDDVMSLINEFNKDYQNYVEPDLNENELNDSILNNDDDENSVLFNEDDNNDYIPFNANLFEDIKSDEDIEPFSWDVNESVNSDNKIEIKDTFDEDLVNKIDIKDELDDSISKIDENDQFDNNEFDDENTQKIDIRSIFEPINNEVDEVPIFNSISDEIEPNVDIKDNDTLNIENDDIFADFDNCINTLDQETEYKKEDNEDLTTDINNLFVKVNSNVQEASDIFLKNVEMKKIIDNRFEELKQLQASVEEARKANLEEINNYKDEVTNTLMSKKEEIEEKLNLLKEMQTAFEKEKSEFEMYKKEETLKIDDKRRDEEENFENRKNELNRIEDKLRRQKDFLEEERRKLSLDQIQYETDKNELANNMIKFNEIVSKFTNGLDKMN